MIAVAFSTEPPPVDEKNEEKVDTTHVVLEKA